MAARLITRQQARAELGLSRAALLRAQAEGVRAIRTTTGATCPVRYLRSELMAWLDRCAERPKPVAVRDLAAATRRSAPGAVADADDVTPNGQGGAA